MVKNHGFMAYVILYIGICTIILLSCGVDGVQDDSMPVHGLYTISYAGDNDCQGMYLAYRRYDKRYPGRVRLQSSLAKRPMTWRVRSLKGNNDIFTIQAVMRAACCPAKLSYARACASKSVMLNKQGLMTWQVKRYPGKNEMFSLFASGRESCTSTNALSNLGPVSALSKGECLSRGVKMFPPLTKGIMWRFNLIQELQDDVPALVPNSSPPMIQPEPNAPEIAPEIAPEDTALVAVTIPRVRTTIVAGETSTDPLERDALCKIFIEMIEYDPKLLDCQLNATVKSRQERNPQSIVALVTFGVENSSSQSVQSAFNASEEFMNDLQSFQLPDGLNISQVEQEGIKTWVPAVESPSPSPPPPTAPETIYPVITPPPFPGTPVASVSGQTDTSITITSLPTYSTTSYRVQCISGDAGCTISDAVYISSPVATVSNYEVFGTVSGITPNAQYSCYMIAVNSIGKACSAKLSTGTLPGVPSNLARQSVTTNSVTLQGDEPVGGADEYKVQCISGAGSACQVSGTVFDNSITGTLAGGIISATVSSLDANTVYSCYIVAVNSIGKTCSAKLEGPTLSYKPAALEVKDGTRACTGSICGFTLTFTAPSATQGSATFTYSSKCVTDSEPCTGAAIPSGGLKAEVTNVASATAEGAIPQTLTAGTIYDCFVVAVNAAGYSECSDALEVTAGTIPTWPAQTSGPVLTYDPCPYYRVANIAPLSIASNPEETYVIKCSSRVSDPDLWNNDASGRPKLCTSTSASIKSSTSIVRPSSGSVSYAFDSGQYWKCVAIASNSISQTGSCTDVSLYELK